MSVEESNPNPSLPERLLQEVAGSEENYQSFSGPLAYSALRLFAEQRIEDTLGDPTLKALWYPSEAQVLLIREALQPRITFAGICRRLSAHLQNQDSMDTLRPHQQDQFSAIVSVLGSAPDISKASTCLVSPAGSGKTHLMMEVLQAVHAEDDVQSKKKSLVLVDTNMLLRQTEERFREALPKVSVGTYNKDTKDLNSQVVIMTNMSFINATKNGNIKKGDFDAVLVDEADKLLAPDTRAELKDFMSSGLALGFTATKQYSEAKHVGLLFENVLDDFDMKTAIQEGALSPVQVWLVGTGQAVDIGKLQRFQDIPQEALQELAKRASRNALAAKFATEFVQHGMRGVVKCIPGDNCAHAKELAADISKQFVTDANTGKKRLIRAAAVGGDINNSEEIIAAYKRGEYDVLCFVKLLGRAFDDPKTAFFIDAAPTLSPVEGVQGPGRAMRLLPNKVAHIVHLLDELVSGGETKPAYTMLHALGIKAYEMGLYFGPTDRWRGNKQQVTHHKMLPLSTLSEEVLALLRNTPPQVIERHLYGRQDVQTKPSGSATMSEIAKLAGVSISQFSAYVKENDAKQVASSSSGFRRYYSLDHVPLIEAWYEYKRTKRYPNGVFVVAHSELPIEKQIGIPKSLRLEQTLQDFIELQYPMLKPVTVVEKIGRNYRAQVITHQFYTAEQVEQLLQILSGAVEIGGAYFVPRVETHISHLTYNWVDLGYDFKNIDNYKLKKQCEDVIEQSNLMQAIKKAPARIQETLATVQQDMGVYNRIAKRGSTYGVFYTQEELDTLRSKLSKHFMQAERTTDREYKKLDPIPPEYITVPAMLPLLLWSIAHDVAADGAPTTSSRVENKIDFDAWQDVFNKIDLLEPQLVVAPKDEYQTDLFVLHNVLQVSDIRRSIQATLAGHPHIQEFLRRFDNGLLSLARGYDYKMKNVAHISAYREETRIPLLHK